MKGQGHEAQARVEYTVGSGVAGRWKGAQLLWDDWGRGQGALLDSWWCCGWLAQVLGKIAGDMKIGRLRAGPHGVMDMILNRGWLLTKECKDLEADKNGF